MRNIFLDMIVLFVLLFQYIISYTHLKIDISSKISWKIQINWERQEVENTLYCPEWSVFQSYDKT